MVQRIIEYNLSQDRKITISLEFEKYRETVLEFMPLADVVSGQLLHLNISLS